MPSIVCQMGTHLLSSLRAPCRVKTMAALPQGECERTTCRRRLEYLTPEQFSLQYSRYSMSASPGSSSNAVFIRV